jgi:radical SAM superfamily enzyme with C-terminal helix-hairpin-helix motif
MNANTISEQEISTIPNLPKGAVEQITKGKPWKSIDDLKKELAKSAGDKEAARIARYLVVS